jgi:hypothetical protein
MSTLIYTNKLGYKHEVHGNVEQTEDGVWLTIAGMNKRFILNSQIITILND